MPVASDSAGSVEAVRQSTAREASLSIFRTDIAEDQDRGVAIVIAAAKRLQELDVILVDGTIGERRRADSFAICAPGRRGDGDVQTRVDGDIDIGSVDALQHRGGFFIVDQAGVKHMFVKLDLGAASQQFVNRTLGQDVPVFLQQLLEAHGEILESIRGDSITPSRNYRSRG